MTDETKAKEKVLPDPTRLLVVGDVHGNQEFMDYVIDKSLEENCDAIFQVGDFGYWPHTAEGIRYLSKTSYTLGQKNTRLYWLDGNHENFDMLYESEFEILANGFWQILPNIYYAPRGLRWTWSKVQFMAMGGAYSVDKHARLRWEASNHHMRAYWWPQETITEGDLHRALANPNLVDILLTHDAPIYCPIPFIQIIEGIPELEYNRRALQEIMDQVKPKTLIHGHFHVGYARAFKGPDYTTDVLGLGCDGMGPQSWHVLDLNKTETHDRAA